MPGAGPGSALHGGLEVVGSLETIGWNRSDNGGELEEETKQGGGHSEKGSGKSNSVPPFFYIPFPIEATVLRF